MREWIPMKVPLPFRRDKKIGGWQNRLPAVPPEFDVTFTGGLGAQILSLGIVLSAVNQGDAVGADLRYFDTPPLSAKGQRPAHWGWALGGIGWSREDVMNLAAPRSAKSSKPLLQDGRMKFQLAMEALQRPEIQKEFPTRAVSTILRELSVSILDESRPYVAFHIRRGDYINVGAALVDLADYVLQARVFSKIFTTAFFLSDSEFPKTFVEQVSHLFTEPLFLSGLDADPCLIHHLLRNAAVHVGSNGQFSLTAGLLSEQLFLTPARWFGPAESPIDDYFRANSTFTLPSRLTSLSTINAT